MKEGTILWLDNEMTQVRSQTLFQRRLRKEKAGHVPKILKDARPPHQTLHGGPSATGQCSVGTTVGNPHLLLWEICDHNSPANPRMLLPSPGVARNVRCSAVPSQQALRETAIWHRRGTQRPTGTLVSVLRQLGPEQSLLPTGTKARASLTWSNSSAQPL